MGNEIKLPSESTLPSISYSQTSDGKGMAGRKKLDKALNDFESFFLSTVFKELDKTTHVSKKKGYIQETYMGVVYEKLGDYLAKKGVGIREAMTRYLDRGGTKVPGQNGDNKVK
jgi:Rod binding domain-containing protein